MYVPKEYRNTMQPVHVPRAPQSKASPPPPPPPPPSPELSYTPIIKPRSVPPPSADKMLKFLRKKGFGLKEI